MTYCIECDQPYPTPEQARACARLDADPRCEPHRRGIQDPQALALATLEAEPDYGGAFDGFTVTSDADPEL
jgi:hypothetical protein